VILAIAYGGSRYDIADTPPGDDGTAATVAAMQGVIDHAVSVTGPALAASLGQVCGDGPDAPERLYHLLRAVVRFQRDPDGVELLRHPADVLRDLLAWRSPRIDCDDLALLGASALAVLGYRPALVTVGRRESGRFEHVYFGFIGNDGELVPMDPQEKVPFGEYGPKAKRIRVWALTVTAVGSTPFIPRPAALAADRLQ
jgi:hypothetical protein